MVRRFSTAASQTRGDGFESLTPSHCVVVIDVDDLALH